MSFNLKSVQTKTTYALIPTGRYNVRVETAECTTSAQNNPVINLKLAIMDDKNLNGRFVFDAIALTDNSLWKVKTLLEKVNSKLGESEKVEPQEIATELTYKKFSVYVYEQTDNQGTARNRTKDYQAYVDPAAKATEVLF